jgi:hypothetical protein
MWDEFLLQMQLLQISIETSGNELSEEIKMFSYDDYREIIRCDKGIQDVPAHIRRHLAETAL